MLRRPLSSSGGPRCDCLKSICKHLVCAVLAVAGSAALHGATIWNADAAQPVKADAAPTGRALEPMRLVAPRSGSSSGQVVVADPGPVTAKCSELVLKGGAARIPATAVQVRYATARTDLSGLADVTTSASPYCDALSPVPVGGAKAQPVWVTVSVPADATPGDYEGVLTFSGGGKVQVQLRVMTYKLPAPKDYTTWIGLNQSINSISDRYGVPLYSDKHFALLEPSLQLLGQLGHHLLSVPIIEQNFVGNSRGLITFRRQGATLTPDFTAMEKYASMQIKHCGVPRVVVLEVWQVYMGMKEGDKIEGRQKDKALLSVLGAKGGYDSVQWPLYPAEEAFWKGLYDEAVARLVKLGIPQESVMLGFYADRRPDRAQVDFWKRVAPQAKWAGYTHAYAGLGPEGATLGFSINPDAYSAGFTGPVRGGWGSGTPFFTSCRDFCTDVTDPVTARRLVDMSQGRTHSGPSRGLSQVGFDFWLVKPEGASRPLRHMEPNDRLYAKHYRLIRGNARAFTVPGPKGALATVRYEMLREGAQETQARVDLERALAEKKVTGKLKDSIEAALVDWHSVWKRPEGDKTPFAVFGVEKWQERSRTLYDLAGQVQAAGRGG